MCILCSAGNHPWTGAAVHMIRSGSGQSRVLHPIYSIHWRTFRIVYTTWREHVPYYIRVESEPSLRRCWIILYGKRIRGGFLFFLPRYIVIVILSLSPVKYTYKYIYNCVVFISIVYVKEEEQEVVDEKNIFSHDRRHSSAFNCQRVYDIRDTRGGCVQEACRKRIRSTVVYFLAYITINYANNNRVFFLDKQQ